MTVTIVLPVNTAFYHRCTKTTLPKKIFACLVHRVKFHILAVVPSRNASIVCWEKRLFAVEGLARSVTPGNILRLPVHPVNCALQEKLIVSMVLSSANLVLKMPFPP